MAWLPEGFVAPARLDLPTGHHLRPIRADDVDIDFPAVMGSQASLWATFGAAWGWPAATMTKEQDRDDLARHEREQAGNLSFNFAAFDADETALYGCVYVDPPEKEGSDADVSWWVVDAERGGALEAAIRDALRPWLTEAWPFTAPRVIGADLSWDEWLALPDVG